MTQAIATSPITGQKIRLKEINDVMLNDFEGSVMIELSIENPKADDDLEKAYRPIHMRGPEDVIALVAPYRGNIAKHLRDPRKIIRIKPIRSRNMNTLKITYDIVYNI